METWRTSIKSALFRGRIGRSISPLVAASSLNLNSTRQGVSYMSPTCYLLVTYLSPYQARTHNLRLYTILVFLPTRPRCYSPRQPTMPI